MKRHTLLAIPLAVILVSRADGREHAAVGRAPQATVDVCDAEGDGFSVGFQGGICTFADNCGMDRAVCSLSARTELLDVRHAATCMPCQLLHDPPERSDDRVSADRFEDRAQPSAPNALPSIETVTVGIAGIPGAGGSITPSLSADGRYVAFDSVAPNLVSGDLNGKSDVFVHDRTLGQTERVTIATGGAESNGDSVAAAISADGRYVAFLSRATNLVASDTNGSGDVFVRDRLNGMTERVNLGLAGAEATGLSWHWGSPALGSWPDLDYRNHEMDNTEVSISDDGRYVAFVSDATNLVAGDTNQLPDVFLRDRVTNQTTRVNVNSGGQQIVVAGDPLQGFHQSTRPHVSLSGDGTTVAFTTAYPAVPADTNQLNDVYVRDLTAGTTSLVSMNAGGGFSGWPSLSHNGQKVAFASDLGILLPARVIYVRDRQAHTTTPVAGNFRAQAPAISADGRLVAFAASGQVYLGNVITGLSRVLTAGNGPSFGAAVSADGTLVAFGSAASDLAPGDTNGQDDVFITQADFVKNGSFGNGTSSWQLFATPDPSYLHWSVVDGVFEFFRQPPPTGTQNQAVAFQQTNVPLPPTTAIEAQFRLGNTSSVRKRISVLIQDSDFSDLSVCTFWLAPHAPLRTYRMLTHTTKAWTNATIAFYAATAGSDGGAYQLDEVSVFPAPGGSTLQTFCIDPAVPPPTNISSNNLIVNGIFNGLPPWITFGQIVWQIAGNVFEFTRPPGTPAGVLLQNTGAAAGVGQSFFSSFQLGNSSAVRKRVTVLLHDADFSDLSACTFWLRPGQPQALYFIRAHATKSWANATLSVYPSTIGPEQWTRLFGVSLSKAAGSTLGTECTEPLASQTNAPRIVSSGGASARRLTESGGSSAAGAPGGLSVIDASENRVLHLDGTIDLTRATSARLRFLSWLLATESVAEVQVSVGGHDWRALQMVTPSGAWQAIDIDLAEFVGEVIELRFVLRDVNPALIVVPDTWRLYHIQVDIR